MVCGVNVLIVNFMYVVIVIDFEFGCCFVFIVSVKGEDYVVCVMCEVVEDVSVFIVCNVLLVCELLVCCEEGEVVLFDFFDVLVEVIVWVEGVCE